MDYPLVQENFILLNRAKSTLNEGTKDSLTKFETKLKSININESINIDDDILNLEELKETLSV